MSINKRIAMHWILLRGLTREQGHWHRFPDALAQARPQDQIVMLDLAGTGADYRSTSPASICEIRRQLQDRAACLPRPLGLVGLSMGGMVALDWAQNAAAGELGRLVLINSSSGFSPPWQRMRPSRWPRLLQLMLGHDLRAREAAILQMSSALPMAPAQLDHWCKIQQQRPVSKRTLLNQMAAAASWRPQAAAPDAQGLLLASRGDRLVDWHCSATLQTRWGWPLALHPTAGHDLPLDDPDWVVAAIQRWCQGLPI